MSQKAIMALVGAAQDGDTFAGQILAATATDTSFDPELHASIAAVAQATPDQTVASVLHHVIDFCPFLAALGSDQRERITAVLADGDQIFSSAVSQAVWEQSGIRTVHAPDACHALPIREPARFARLLLEILGTRTA